MDLRVRQYENSIIDDLTGVHNRRYLMDSIDHELAFAARHRQPLCLMLVDIDHFKQINDSCGHQAGDAVIKQLAERIADSLRSEDIFARVGGEEFAILTRGLDGAAALEAAERVRTLVEARPFTWQANEMRCTISVGGTILSAKEPLDASHLLKRADDNLYRAKDAGRNNVIIG
jgi:diguanylate cyclase (GGDEF)-like protein